MLRDLGVKASKQVPEKLRKRVDALGTGVPPLLPASDAASDAQADVDEEGDTPGPESASTT